MTDTTTNVTAPGLDAKVARQVLWHFREPGGMEPGEFIKALLTAMARADPMNLRRLGLGYPGYALAMSMAQNTDFGIAWLQEAAGVSVCAECKGGGMISAALPGVDSDHAVRHLEPCRACRGRGTT